MDRSADSGELIKRLSGTPLTILVAEDSESIQALLSLYFKQTACELVFAETGRKAVDLFKSRHFDLVLMDIFMPVLDGLDATREIRAFETAQGLEPTPIVAVSANAFTEDRARSIDAGCTDFLSKPVRKPDVLRCVISTMHLG